jgi:hypothetical protein
MYLHPCASGYTDERIADAGPPHTRARAASVRARVLRPCARVCCVRARARLRVCDWASPHPRRHVRARSVSVDRGWLGSQAFYSAEAFNANIGAWNTARVTMLDYVCPALSARRDALGGSSMRRRPLCAAAPNMRARGCAQTCGARACAGVHVRRYSWRSI